jgi:hypothetical protein
VRTRKYAVFVASPSRQSAVVDQAVRAYSDADPPPRRVTALYRRHAGALNSLVMLGRLRRGRALLLTLIEDDELLAFGWIQSWKPLRREFWWLDHDGICMGPYWTHTGHRGRGLYGRLLAHSLHECGCRWRDKTWYIWARSDNAPSIRGIEKAGFEPLGIHRVSLYAGGLCRRHEQLSRTPT